MIFWLAPQCYQPSWSSYDLSLIDGPSSCFLHPFILHRLTSYPTGSQGTCTGSQVISVPGAAYKHWDVSLFLWILFLWYTERHGGDKLHVSVALAAPYNGHSQKFRCICSPSLFLCNTQPHLVPGNFTSNVLSSCSKTPSWSQYPPPPLCSPWPAAPLWLLIF